MNLRIVVATSSLALIILIAPMLFSGMLSLTTTQKVNAQMNTSNINITGISGLNTTGIPVGDISQNTTKSVNIIPTIVKAVLSQVNVSLVDAAMSAEKQVGNSSQTVAAILTAPNGYLVYEVYTISDPDANMEKVIVHPGTGQVLAHTTELGGPVNMIPGGIGMMPSGSDIGIMGGPYP